MENVWIVHERAPKYMPFFDLTVHHNFGVCPLLWFRIVLPTVSEPVCLLGMCTWEEADG